MPDTPDLSALLARIDRPTGLVDATSANRSNLRDAVVIMASLESRLAAVEGRDRPLDALAEAQMREHQAEATRAALAERLRVAEAKLAELTARREKATGCSAPSMCIHGVGLRDECGQCVAFNEGVDFGRKDGRASQAAEVAELQARADGLEVERDHFHRAWQQTIDEVRRLRSERAKADRVPPAPEKAPRYVVASVASVRLGSEYAPFPSRESAEGRLHEVAIHGRDVFGWCVRTAARSDGWCIALESDIDTAAPSPAQITTSPAPSAPPVEVPVVPNDGNREVNERREQLAVAIRRYGDAGKARGVTVGEWKAVYSAIELFEVAAEKVGYERAIHARVTAPAPAIDPGRLAEAYVNNAAPGYGGIPFKSCDDGVQRKTVEAMRRALASLFAAPAAQGEPVAWGVDCEGTLGEVYLDLASAEHDATESNDNPKCRGHRFAVVPLYRAPVAAQEPVHVLTVEMLTDALVDTGLLGVDTANMYAREAFAHLGNVAVPAVSAPTWSECKGLHRAVMGRLTLTVGVADGLAWWKVYTGLATPLRDVDMLSDDIAAAKSAAVAFACSLNGATVAVPAQEVTVGRLTDAIRRADWDTAPVNRKDVLDFAADVFEKLTAAGPAMMPAGQTVEQMAENMFAEMSKEHPYQWSSWECLNADEQQDVIRALRKVLHV